MSRCPMLLRCRLNFRSSQSRIQGHLTKQFCGSYMRRLYASHSGVDTKQLLAALTYEETCDFVNAMGRNETFSTFVSRSVKMLEPVPSRLERQHACVSIAFKHYDSLDRQTRKLMIASTRDIVTQLSTSGKTTNGARLPEQKPRSMSLAELQIADSVDEGDQGADDEGATPAEHPKAMNGATRVMTLGELNRELFSRIAELNSSSDDSGEEDMAEMEQGSAEWQQARQQRLTASSFANVLGMFGDPENSIRDVWLEKIGLKEPFRGNQMTRWGTKHEKEGREMYERITGHRVKRLGIGVMGKHPSEHWIGASPDGLIKTRSDGKEKKFSGRGRDIIMPETTKGILEIKCPYGSRFGNPEDATPYSEMRAHYIPQVQCLMDVFDREWCHVYVWTKTNGSKIFYIPRDRAYYRELYQYLSKFWWEHVVPAKRRLQEDENKTTYKAYEPTKLDPTHLVNESHRLARLALELTFDSNGLIRS